MFVECLAGVNKMGHVGICTYWLIWLALHWCRDYVYIVSFVYSCYIILVNLVIVSWRPSYIICNPSTIVWIPYSDLWELVNTTIEPMTTNRVSRFFKVEIGNWVKMGVGASSVHCWCWFSSWPFPLFRCGQCCSRSEVCGLSGVMLEVIRVCECSALCVCTQYNPEYGGSMQLRNIGSIAYIHTTSGVAV
jgi:hypothetical protein